MRTWPSPMNESCLSTTVRDLFDIMMSRKNVDAYDTTSNQVLCMHRFFGRVMLTHGSVHDRNTLRNVHVVDIKFSIIQTRMRFYPVHCE